MSQSLTKIKKYTLLDQIGCGGMGEVYIGVDPDINKTVAIKILTPQQSSIEEILKRFKIECKILKSLNHPNIVKYIDSGNDGDIHYLVMEYVKGISFNSFPKTHKLTNCGIKQTLPSLEEYITIFIKCFEALSYIHKLGIIHRDIKPSNIILSGSNYNPILIDFGIAKYLNEDDDLSATSKKFFTLAYASPEQLSNKPLDVTSDLFSFGVVMYEKLTGALPFKGNTQFEVFLAHTKWDFPPPRQLAPEIPQKLEQIILRLLAKDPSSRYPSAQMVIGELDKLLAVVKQTSHGLELADIKEEIREISASIELKRTFKKRTIADEQQLVKKARSEYLEAKEKLRKASMKINTNLKEIEDLKMICNTLKAELDKVELQLKMALGFKSQPLVIDKFNTIFKLETIAYEKKGIPLQINIIEQKLAHIDGSDIIVGNINFSEKSKKVYSINQQVNYLTWDSSNWFFNAYEEKDFPIFIMIGDKKTTHPPAGFKGFFWPFEFIIAISKLGKTGVSIIETFHGVDRNGKAILAKHKETILFAQNLFDSLISKLDNNSKGALTK